MADDPVREQRLQAAIELRESGRFEAAVAAMDLLVAEYESDAEINYHAAWARDRLGDEAGAIPLYERALSCDPGLTAEEKYGLYVGLGSSYRLLGRFDDSLRILRSAVAEYPHNAALSVFQSLTLADAGDPTAALGVLLELVATAWDRPEIEEFRRPILEYAAALGTGRAG